MIGHDRRNEDDKGHHTDTYYRTLIVGYNYNFKTFNESSGLIGSKHQGNEPQHHLKQPDEN